MAKVAKGKVKRIYASYATPTTPTPTTGKIFIQLAGLVAALKPKNEYFFIESTHPNYNAIYSLTLVAAVNRYDITIRTADDITSQDEAKIEYIVVDW